MSVSDSEAKLPTPIKQLAEAKDLKASFANGVLKLTAEVLMVTTCAKFSFQETPTPIEPPQFEILTWEQAKPGELCGQVVATVPFTGEIHMASAPATIIVHTHGKENKVTVTH